VQIAVSFAAPQDPPQSTSRWLAAGLIAPRGCVRWALQFKVERGGMRELLPVPDCKLFKEELLCEAARINLWLARASAEGMLVELGSMMASSGELPLVGGSLRGKA
jgi:hypothetical protein